MEWYMPIAILPGVSILLVSTANLIISLNEEINLLLDDKQDQMGKTIFLKLAQLKRLSLAMVSLYIGIFLFLISGLLAIVPGFVIYVNLLLGVALIAVSMALVLLIRYAIKAVSIRQYQFKKKFSEKQGHEITN